VFALDITKLLINSSITSIPIHEPRDASITSTIFFNILVIKQTLSNIIEKKITKKSKIM